MIMPVFQLIGFGFDIQCCSTLNVASADSQDQPTDDKETCNDICNPFLSCNTCLGFIVTGTNKVTFTLNLSELQPSVCFESPSMEFPYTIWHPPKLG